jgi:hypothetical protein
VHKNAYVHVYSSTGVRCNDHSRMWEPVRVSSGRAERDGNVGRAIEVGRERGKNNDDEEHNNCYPMVGGGIDLL